MMMFLKDMKRAMKFYSDGFGWKTQKTNFENYVLWTSEGVGGGLFQSKGPIVSNKDSTVHFAVTPSDTLDSTVERSHLSLHLSLSLSLK
jgi:predicted enzyme related to lactoylglutathione lyase